MIAHNTFCYECTKEGSIQQEVHLINGQYFFCSKVLAFDTNKPETMIFHCNENGTVLDWGGEWTENSDKDLNDVVLDFSKTFKTFETNKEKHDG